MALEFPNWGSFRSAEYGATTGDSLAITISDGTSANTKATSYTDLIASVPFDTTGLILMIGPIVNIPQYLIDIAIGASSSEVNIINNLFYSGQGTSIDTGIYYFPIKIPVGSRLSARCQSTGSNGTMEISVIVLNVGYPNIESCSRVTTYGVTSSGATSGTGLDPGGTINTKPGAPYTEIISSTTNPIRQMLITFGDKQNAGATTASWLIDVAIGAASSEVDIFPNLRISSGTTTDQPYPLIFGPYPCNIPAGTRLSARCQCSINDATDRLIEVAIYGID